MIKKWRWKEWQWTGKHPSPIIDRGREHWFHRNRRPSSTTIKVFICDFRKDVENAIQNE